MIEGFEDETAPLTPQEKEIIPGLVEGFKVRIGKHRAIKSSEISRKLKDHGYRVEGPRVRKLVNHIRINRLVPGLIATSHGYYVAETLEELRKYAKSLQDRIDAIAAVRNSVMLDIDDRRKVQTNSSGIQGDLLAQEKE